MISAIILTHGKLGSVMMESVERILGPQEDVVVMSNDALSLEQMIQQVADRLPDQPAVFFVDFFGGSPFSACKMVRESHPEHALISGVNLPLLFSFFTKRGKLPFAQLVETVKADGLRGIQLLCE